MAKTTLTTASGSKVDYLKPKNINLADVALGLSRQPRYAGQTRVPYSVAQHCLFVAELANPALRAYALVHDAQEAFLCDLPTPAKEALRALGDGAYDELEARLYYAICEAVGLEKRKPIVLSIWDKKAREIEMPMLHPGFGPKRTCQALERILKYPDGARTEWLYAVRSVSEVPDYQGALSLSAKMAKLSISRG